MIYIWLDFQLANHTPFTQQIIKDKIGSISKKYSNLIFVYNTHDKKMSTQNRIVFSYFQLFYVIYSQYRI